MRLNLFYNNFFLIFFLIIILINFKNITFAKNNLEIQLKVKQIALQLRCMTCQNQSIYDSDAEFSNDIKNLIEKQIKEGKTEKEIIKFMVDRYGEYVVFKPLMNEKNIFLWLFPFVLFLISLFFLILRLKKQ
tara:strand:- start:192 stop:587 length:396 start_codon:yes stop_codon:yes gene_type:complete